MNYKQRMDLLRKQQSDEAKQFGPRVEEGEGNKRNNQRVKQQLMRQFLRIDGPAGNSAKYLEGWERTFGRK